MSLFSRGLNSATKKRLDAVLERLFALQEFFCCGKKKEHPFVYHRYFSDIFEELEDEKSKRGLIENQIKSLQKAGKNLDAQIDIAEIFIEKIISESKEIQMLSLYRKLERNPWDWREILIEIKDYKLLDAAKILFILGDEAEVIKHNPIDFIEFFFNEEYFSNLSDFPSSFDRTLLDYFVTKEKLPVFLKHYNFYTLLNCISHSGNHQAYIEKLWSFISEEQKKSLFNPSISKEYFSLYSSCNESVRAEIAEYLSFDFGIFRFIKWIPKEKRLIFLKKCLGGYDYVISDIPNALFEPDCDFLAKAGKEDEILTKKEIDDLFLFVKEKYDKSNFDFNLKRTVEQYEEWKKKNPA